MNLLQISLTGIFGSSNFRLDSSPSSKYDGYLGVGKFEDGFDQWRDAMKAVTRLPEGLPANSRRKMWLTLAENWLDSRKGLDWSATSKMAFNELIDPEDDELDYQIVKDLHRTGCSSFSGLDNDHERALLKRVLLAYARWNKSVGYCQGFNVIAAVILDVMDRNESEALKVMIFLVDGVLPKSYFTDNLRDLAVDMAVFSDLLATHLPRLHAHLDRLRLEECSTDDRPPLTDVFTMQWFLTLFATQLPVEAVLRVWDAVLLEGSEILIRTSLALWGLLQDEVLREIRSADDFYTQMGEILARTVDAGSGIVEVDRLMTIVYQLAPFPLPQLKELREKHFQTIGSQKSELEKWQKRLRDGHSQASQYLQLTPQKIHKSYKKVTGLVLPSVPNFVSEESMINHLKLPRQTTAPAAVVPDATETLEDSNRRILHVKSASSSAGATSPSPAPSPTPSEGVGGAKPKSGSPQPRRMSSLPGRCEFQHSRRSSHGSARTDSESQIRQSDEDEARHRERCHRRHEVRDAKDDGRSKTRANSSSSSKALQYISTDDQSDYGYRHPSPFPHRPGKSKSRQRSEYGIKLGLYAPQKEHRGDVHGGLSGPRHDEDGLHDVTHITRYHINACMARESEAYNGGGFPR